jgi:colanic acid/amylovoran biosynthesis glycosyltransferase
MSRILMVVYSFPKLSETFIVSKFLGLLDAGYDVHILANDISAKDWDKFPRLAKNGALRERIHRIGGGANRFQMIWAMLKALFLATQKNPRQVFAYFVNKLKRRQFSISRLITDIPILSLQADIIHFEFGTLAAERIDIKPFTNAKIIVSLRGYDISYHGLNIPDFYKQVWEKASAIHCLGTDLWELALQRGCPETMPHTFISPAIDTDYFSSNERFISPTGSPERPLRILSVGRLQWKKGYEYALQAMKILKEQGLHFEYHIVGTGNYDDMVAYSRHLLGLDAEVQLLGAQHQDCVKEQMQWADILVHSAVSEGFCNVVIEAQAMQLAVIAADAEGLAENIDDEQTGYIVPKRSPKDLAKAIMDLNNEPAKRQTMGIKGQKRVQEKFRLSQQIAAFVEFYEKVLQN